MFGQVSARITRRGTLRCRLNLTSEVKELILRKIRTLQTIGGYHFKVLAMTEGANSKLIFLSRVYKVVFVANYALLYKKKWTSAEDEEEEALFIYIVSFLSLWNNLPFFSSLWIILHYSWICLFTYTVRLSLFKENRTWKNAKQSCALFFSCCNRSSRSKL